MGACFFFISRSRREIHRKSMSSRKGSPCYGNVSLQSISLWYSGLYCVSPSLCNSLYWCWFSGCFVIPSSIFWALRPVQCLVSSPPLSLHSGPWSSVLTPAAHPGPDVKSRITALSHRVWAPVKFANSCEASLQSPSFHTVHETLGSEAHVKFGQGEKL